MGTITTRIDAPTWALQGFTALPDGWVIVDASCSGVSLPIQFTLSPEAARELIQGLAIEAHRWCKAECQRPLGNPIAAALCWEVHLDPAPPLGMASPLISTVRYNIHRHLEFQRLERAGASSNRSH